MELTLNTPLYIDLPRKRSKAKRIYLSLNVYRNLHHTSSNAAKHAYKRIVWDQLDAMDTYPIPTPCKVTVTLYAPDKRDRDLGNFGAIAQKFVDDAVVEYGLLPDDSVKYIKECSYLWGGVDTANPRFEVKYEQMI